MLADLGGKDEFIAAVRECVADAFLRETVCRGGVQERDAEIQSGVEQGSGRICTWQVIGVGIFGPGGAADLECAQSKAAQGAGELAGSSVIHG